MDFGIFLDFVLRPGNTPEEAFKESFDLVDLAEAMGLDTVWLGEMHFNPNRSVLSAPIVVASAIATRTKRLRVGMAVQVLPLIHPLRIAEEAATVDQLSQGRFEFGVGRSGNVGVSHLLHEAFLGMRSVLLLAKHEPACPGFPCPLSYPSLSTGPHKRGMEIMRLWPSGFHTLAITFATDLVDH